MFGRDTQDSLIFCFEGHNSMFVRLLIIPMAKAYSRPSPDGIEMRDGSQSQWTQVLEEVQFVANASEA